MLRAPLGSPPFPYTTLFRSFFFWTAANTLTIVFIAKGVEATGGKVDIDKLTTVLLIGAVMWSYLGIVFELDRKSTRLNSSHRCTSYAVFCLKKKKNIARTSS